MSDTSFVPGGPATPESGDLRDDDFGVGPDAGDLRAQLTRALEERWNADDPGATSLPDDVDTPPAADTAATPAPASEPSPTASQGQSGETGDGGGRAAGDGTDGQGAAASTPAASDASAPPASTPTPDDFDLGAYLNDYFGTPLNREQAQQLAAMIGGLQSLSPQQRAELDRVLAGEAAGQYPATMGVPVQQPAPTMQPQHAGGQAGDNDPAIAILGPRPDDEYLASQWDINARVVRHQAQETEALRGEIARTTQMELERQRQANVEKIDAAVNTWREQYPVLSDAEFDALRARAERSGTFPALVQAHHGDVSQAVTALFDQHFWADDTFRERAIANLQSGRVPGDATRVDPSSEVAQQQAQTDAGRQALASSVAGGGGSVTPQSTGIPRDPNKRKEAMAQEIAANHDFT